MLSEKMEMLIRKSLPMINFYLELEEPELPLEEGLQKRTEGKHAIDESVKQNIS